MFHTYMPLFTSALSDDNYYDCMLVLEAMAMYQEVTNFSIKWMNCYHKGVVVLDKTIWSTRAP